MILSLLENFFEQLVFWEKMVAAIAGIIGAIFLVMKFTKGFWVNVKKANKSMSDFFEVIPDLKTIAKDFGGANNTLKSTLQRLENNLWHTDQKIKVIAACIGVAAFESDKNGLYTFISKKWAELTGISFDEAYGNGWLNMVNEDERDEVYKEWISCINQNREFHTNFRLSNFPDRAVSIVAWPIRNLDGSVEKFFGIVI